MGLLIAKGYTLHKRSIIFFFTTAFGIYAAVNFYVFIHGWNALATGSAARLPFLIVYVFLSLAFIAARVLQRVWLSTLTIALDWIGAFWLAALMYLVMAVVIIDIVRVVYAFVPFIAIAGDGQLFRQNVLIVTVAIIAIIVVAGHINARIPRIRNLDLAIHKSGGAMNEMTLVVASDIHLGTIFHNKRLERLIMRIDALSPDLILLPGDVFDEDIGSVIRQNQGETLRKLKAPLGVFAITGNHEYIGGVEPACAYLEAHGIRVLRDQTIDIAGITIVGREDRAIYAFDKKKRKHLSELMQDVDRSRPIIMMDHQPFRLEEAVEQGVDLQLSGHTHHGQLWPAGFITKRIFEVSWGYKKKENTHFYVSCGVGTWGPPVRTGNRPEIVLVKLRFTEQHS